MIYVEVILGKLNGENQLVLGHVMSQAPLAGDIIRYEAESYRVAVRRWIIGPIPQPSPKNVDSFCQLIVRKI